MHYQFICGINSSSNYIEKKYFEGSVNSLKFTDHGYEDLLVAISPDVPVKNAQLIIGNDLKISKILVHQLKFIAFYFPNFAMGKSGTTAFLKPLYFSW